jgi:hypothetical protein
MITQRFLWFYCWNNPAFEVLRLLAINSLSFAEGRLEHTIPEFNVVGLACFGKMKAHWLAAFLGRPF